ncbi:MAG: hypothetical protein PWQ25_1188 [Deferribacteres bacterium]|nr:hypothetical protein [Deferribacteres bacterium]
MKLKVTFLALFLCLWQIVSLFFENYVLPSPYTTLLAIFRMIDYNLLNTVVVSFFRLFLAYVLSVVISVFFSVSSQFSKNIGALIETVMSSIIKVPNIAYLTIFMLIIGVGSYTVMATIAITIIPATTLAFIAILKQLDENILEVTDIFEVIYFKRIFYLYLPMIFESFYPVFQMSFSLGFKIMVMAEFIAGVDGLGYKLVEKKISFNIDELFGYVVIMTFTGIFFQKLLEVIYLKIKDVHSRI